MRKVLFILVCVGAGLLATGCAAQQPVQAPEPVCLTNTLPEQAMAAAQTVLEKMQFEIEKYDTDVMYVRTQPLSGAQFFEFWRKDNVSAYDNAQANLHSIRRTAELTFTPNGTTTCVECQVYVQRLSIPESPLISTSQMGGVHTKSHTRFQTLKVDAERMAMSEWVDEDPDHALEQRILNKIHGQLQ